MRTRLMFLGAHAWFIVVALSWTSVEAFSITSMSSSPSSVKTIYNVPGSGWKSSSWRWGYGSGTGHDCAAICRQRYSSEQDRSVLIEQLIDAPNVLPIQERLPANFEEVKLVLALAWQRGRWDGTDGGEGGYGEVLEAMADARRYEDGDDDATNARRLVMDMQERFLMLNPPPEDIKTMKGLLEECESDADAAVRRCSGLVLKAMGFVEDGL